MRSIFVTVLRLSFFFAKELNNYFSSFFLHLAALGAHDLGGYTVQDRTRARP